MGLYHCHHFRAGKNGVIWFAQIDHWSWWGEMRFNSLLSLQRIENSFAKAVVMFYDNWSRSSLKTFFFTLFNTGPSAKGPTDNSSEIFAGKSSNVSLSCWIDYDDYCPDEFVWCLNDNPKPLPESGEKYNVDLKDTHTKCQKEFILSIFDFTESDEGTYSCHWLCEDENILKAAIDLKVISLPPTGMNFLNFSFATKPGLLNECHN